MLYPPILANTQPVIDIATKSLEIKYSLAPITSIDDFTYIEVFIAQQSNGRSIINSTTGTLTFHKYNISNNTISINSSSFYEDDWTTGKLYKVQLRLVTEDDQVSEWSTVMIIKTITAPSLGIKAEDVNLSDEQVVSSLTPTFQGICAIDSTDKEIEERYQFKIYKVNIDSGARTIIVESGWQNHILGQDDIWHINTVLTIHDSYTIYYEIYTNNGYNAAQQYDFIVSAPAIEDIISFNVQAIQNVTNARIDLMLSATEQMNPVTSNYVITRTSDKSNFLEFEDIKFLNYIDQSIPQTNSILIFSDYTIESGVVYKYGFQRISTYDSKRSAMVMSNTVSVDFEYSYLYRDGIQLRLALNHSVSSFKHTVLRSKQDTLGSKYPFVLQNGNAYYAEFPISGLISYQDNYSEDLSGWKYGSWKYNPNTREEILIIDNPNSPYPASLDTSSTFFINKTDGVYYKGEKIIDQSKFSIHKGETIEKTVEREDGSSYTSYQTENPFVDFTIDNNLTDNNIFIERKFREKVEEFLNEFNYKLYKSPTEGNIVIVLMNVSLKPIESLGRMLYEFSATACEILDNDLESLDTYGIITIGEVKNLAELIENDPLSFGQLIIKKELFEDYTIDESGQGYFKPIDLITLIKEQQHTAIDDESIEDENNSEYEYAFKDVRTLWIEPVNFEKVVGNFVELSLNNTPIFVPLNRIFTITIPYNNINSKIAASLTLAYTETPLIINYVCTNHLQLKTNNIQRTISTTDFYDFDQVVWNRKTDSYGGNLRAYIQNYLINKLNINRITESYWDHVDGNRIQRYEFHFFDSIDIETQLGAVIQIGRSSDTADTFIIGENLASTRIFFKNIFHDNVMYDKYISIDNAEQAIINFTYYITESKLEIVSSTQEGE